MGVCVFGQGDCSDKLNRELTIINKSIAENIKNTLIQKVVSTNAFMSGTQQISFRGSRNCTVGDINQSMSLKIDLNKVASSMDQYQVNNMIKNAISATTNNNDTLKKGFGSLYGTRGTDVTDKQRITNDNINRVVSNYTNQEFETDIQTVIGLQNIDFAGSIDCKVGDIGQFMALDILSKKISNRVVQDVVSMMVENGTIVKRNNTLDIESSGPLESLGNFFKSMFDTPLKIFFIILVLILLITIPTALYFLLRKSPESPESPPQYTQTSIQTPI